MSALVLRASDHLEKSAVTVARFSGGPGEPGASPVVVLGVTPGEGPSRNPKRQPNEDTLGAVAIAGGVAVAVADAHFGARAGEALVAGALAALEAAAPGTPDALRELVLALDAAHERLLEDESETTLLLALVRERRVVWASVADSVLLRIGPRGAVRLNAAGSYFAGGTFLLRDLVKRLSPWRVVDAGELTLEPGELLLLASDGLEPEDSGLEVEEVAALLVGTGSPSASPGAGSLEERVRALVARAGSTARGGGRDNVAVGVVQA